jgi:hypothetical protein
MLPLDLDAFIALNGWSGVDPSKLVITIEAYGARGSKAHSSNSGDGHGGEHGYASTTWTYQAFLDHGPTDLYLYVGEVPSCSGCGGAATLVLFRELGSSAASDDFLIGGGGGGGGQAGSGHNGGNGGRGGMNIGGEAYIGSGDGGGDGGKGGSTGQGGPGGCSEATPRRRWTRWLWRNQGDKR